MAYSKSYFGKELMDLTFEDIEKFFIEEKDESDKIEFKAYADELDKKHKEKENKILRTICGLLNSEGGIIIWGAPIGKTIIEFEITRKIFVGILSPVTRLIEKDSFINRITDSITPSPRGIEFLRLEKNNNYVYIIDVEKSNYSPHQIKNSYFMRLDGQTVYAPHHYIEALFKKITYPRLEGYIKIESVNTSKSPDPLNGTGAYRFNFSLIVFNKSKLQNEYELTCRVLISNGIFDKPSATKSNYKFYPSDGEVVIENAKPILFYGEVFYHTETIIFSFENINEEFSLSFFFGGKASPMMFSEYTISLKSIPLKTVNYNSMIVELNENQYLHEFGDKIELSEKEKLKQILGR